MGTSQLARDLDHLLDGVDRELDLIHDSLLKLAARQDKVEQIRQSRRQLEELLAHWHQQPVRL